MTKHADELGQTMRRFLTGLHSSGLVFTISALGFRMNQGISPTWAWPPALIFLAGLVCIGLNIAWAKHKRLKQDAAVENGEARPAYNRFFQRNSTHHGLILLLFVAGVVVFLWTYGATFETPVEPPPAVIPGAERP